MKLRDYLTEADQKVGKTILAQIRAQDKFALPAWGAKNFVTTSDPGGVHFDVRGGKFRGRVVIVYDRGKDSYNIEFGQIRKMDWKPKKQIKGIYADQLVQALDDYIG